MKEKKPTTIAHYSFPQRLPHTTLKLGAITFPELWAPKTTSLSSLPCPYPSWHHS